MRRTNVQTMSPQMSLREQIAARERDEREWLRNENGEVTRYIKEDGVDSERESHKQRQLSGILASESTGSKYLPTCLNYHCFTSVFTTMAYAKSSRSGSSVNFTRKEGWKKRYFLSGKGPQRCSKAGPHSRPNLTWSHSPAAIRCNVKIVGKGN